MTPEDRLFAAVIDNAIDASLRMPMGELPEYDCQIGTKEWITIRDKRRKIREDEENRLEGKEAVMSEYLALLYKMVYHTSIDPLRKLLQYCWGTIEAIPEQSLKYRKILDRESMNMADRKEW